MAIYMKYGSINGAVTTQGFAKWIELDSFQCGVGRAIGTAARGATHREGSEPSISEITVTKKLDVATPGLFQDAVAGQMDNKVEIKFTTTTKGTVTTYLGYELTDTGLSGWSTSSGGDTPVESLSLNFTKVIMSYSGFDPKMQGSPLKTGYDLTQMQTT